MDLTMRLSRRSNVISEETEAVDSAEDLDGFIDDFTGGGTFCNSSDLRYYIEDEEIELSNVMERLGLSDHERFNLILKKCHTTNASRRPIFSLNELEDEDLVNLADLAPDYSYVFEKDNWGRTIANMIIEKVGLEDSEDSIAVYEEAVEILRKKIG